MTRITLLIALGTTLALATSCKKNDAAEGATTAKDVPSEALECDHDLRSSALARHTWPYPADHRNLVWKDRYTKLKLKLKPNASSFVTATISVRSDDFLEVEDSLIRITKPRRLVAKRDLFVRRKVWNQGIQVEQTVLAVGKGEVGSFLFYNSEGLCMVGTDDAPGWTRCTLDDAFEGLSEENPDPCEQEWWVKLRRSKVDQGWLQVNADSVERLPPPPAAAK